ncbi:MAG: potassium channel family protein [Spirochaetota bacterium]
MRIIIVGIGEIGLRLANLLGRRRDNELVLVDHDTDRADEISNSLDALVLHGDGSNPGILEKAQVSKADALVASTGSDQINTVIAMLGKNYGVGKVMVVLHSAVLRPACERIGVSAIFSPKVAAAAEMISTIYGFDRINFSLIASGGLTLDVIVVPGERTQTLDDLTIPRGVHPVAVRRAEDLLIPYPDLMLEPEDELILMYDDEAAFNRVQRQLADTDDE